MKETRYNLRLTREEKKLLDSAAKQSGISILSYIKQRLFFNNPDFSENKYVYECPPESRHNYILMGVLMESYVILCQIISQDKTTEEYEHLRDNCFNLAKRSVEKYGYLKVDKKGDE